MFTFIVAVVAWIMAGIGEVDKGLRASIENKPGWALRPTFGIVLIIILLWPWQLLVQSVARQRSAALGVAWGIFNIALLFSMFFCAVYVLAIVPLKLADTTLWRVVLYGIEIVLAPVVMAIVSVVLTVVSIPLQIAFGALLGIVLPQRTD
ncbi:putative membrane protein [Burkholderia pseudomallei MSHR983]|nr:putative membrane protein [Burkholderia pseudomallei MSHR983]